MDTSLREIEPNSNIEGKKYYAFECRKCGQEGRNTYVEPHYSNMLERRLCWHCNYWHDQDLRLAKEHTSMVIIAGHIYGPGNRTSGSFRGMAGRRFDIEFIEPSIHAGKRITTFDLWSGSTLPDQLKAKYPDTAVFLNGAERVPMGDGGCWNPSDNKTEPYPLPRSLGIA